MFKVEIHLLHVNQMNKKRMAEAEVEKCLNWLLEQKNGLEQSSFGCNRQSVDDAKKQHSQTRSTLHEYRKHLDKVRSNNTLTDVEIQALHGTYQAVQTLAEKRSCCMDVVTGIASMEEQIQSLSTEFDNRAVHLVNLTNNNKPKNGPNLSNESLAKATQNCMSAVHQSWRWLDEVMQCAHVHLANAAAYHEFFHDVEEVDYWMNAIMSTMHLSFNKAKLGGDAVDLSAINKEIKDTLLAYLRWQSKVDSLFTRARDIVPVPKRTQPIQDPCPVMALTSFKTDEIEFNEGETLTLLDNSDKSKWQVKNARDQTGMVPAVILLINAPSGTAVDAALRLRLQLLSLWTTSVKRLGFQMIAFMQLILKDWTDEEIKAIQNMPKQSRDDLCRILETTETTMQNNWAGYEGFEELQERIARLRTILEEAGNKPGSGNEVSGQVVIQVKMLEDLFNNYQEFYTYWDTYKVVGELLKQPKYILVCDKWDQLKYTTTAHFVRFWDTNLQVPKDGSTKYKAEAALTLHEKPKSKLEPAVAVTEEIQPEAVEESFTCQKVDKTDSTVFDALNKYTEDTVTTSVDEEQYTSAADITEVRRREHTTTDEVVSSMTEVKHTFIIRSVTDPQTQEEISLEDAVIAGIIDQAAGRYVNPQTKTSVSLQEAMALGDITVQFKSQQKIREEKSSYGIITVKTSKETRPYTITGVIDPRTDDEIPVEAAYQRGILSRTEAIYKTETGDVISVIDAIQSGLVKADFHGAEGDDVEEETKTYAVNGVVDQRRKDKVSFHEALNKGLLEAESGMYVNNTTWERVPITEAIMRGFIKARVVTDTSNLNIDPSNKIVVQRLATVKEKILKAVKVARAFKTNAEAQNQMNGK